MTDEEALAFYKNAAKQRKSAGSMKAYEVRVNDAKPQVGIFEIVDGKVFYDSKTCNPVEAVGGAVDAGDLFHRDLCRQILQYHANELEDESLSILKLPESSAPWMYFPRGRVWYDVKEDMYCISTCKEAYSMPGVIAVVMNLFSLPRMKVKRYIDGDYDLWDLKNLKR